jgi:hypothetical protein
VFKGNSKHVTGGQATLFHRAACECRESYDVPADVDKYKDCSRIKSVIPTFEMFCSLAQ